MKTITLRAVIFITSLILLSGCDDNTQENNFQNKNEVRFESAMTIDKQEKSTKITQDELNPDKSKWEVNDRIGISAVNKGSSEILEGYKNIQFRSLEGNNTTAFEAVGEKIYYPEDGAKLLFKAYYPFIESNQWQGNEIAIGLTDQRDLSKLDLLYAIANNQDNGYGAADQNTPVSLVFKHQLSMLSMSILSSDDSSLEVKIQNTAGKVFFDVETGLLKTEESSKETIINVPLNKKNNKYECILSPTELNNAVLLIKQGGKEYKHDLLKTFATLEKGKKHKLNISVKNGLLTEGNIEDWSEENGEDIVLGNEDSNDKEILLNLLKINNELLQAEGKKLTVEVSKLVGNGIWKSTTEEANWSEEKDVKEWNGVEWRSVGGKDRVVELSFGKSNIKKLPSDFNRLSELEALFLHGSTITDVSAISGIVTLKTLYLENCDKLENILLKDLPSVEILSFEYSLNVKKVHLDNMPKMQTLNWIYHYELTEVSLANMDAVEQFSISNSFELEKLSLSNMGNLKSVWLYLTKISDLSFLSKIKSIEDFDFYVQNTSNTISLAPLSGLQNIEYLDINGVEITDISALSGLHALKKLSLKGSKVSSLAPLSNLKKLESLTIGASQLNDISALAGLSKLKGLTMHDLTSPIELSPISGLPDLWLILYGSTSLDNISFVSGLSNLRSLQVSAFTNLTSVNLSDMTNLKSLTIGKPLLPNDNIRICGVADWQNVNIGPYLEPDRAKIFCH